MKVALVVMPFAALTRPSLSVGLLQAGLRRDGIDCEAVYLNLLLGRMLGVPAYRRFSSDAAITTLAGEWVFSQMLFGQRCSTWERYRLEVLEDPVWGTSTDRHDEILALLEIAPAFLDHAFEARAWGDYDLVGFTSTFEQTMPSLCLASRIREHHPSTLLALGGANVESVMGQPYLDGFEFLDFVCTGEADASFPRLCASIREFKFGRAASIVVPAGFLFRPEACRTASAAAPARVDLEQLPTPDYDDFFRSADSEVVLERDGGPRNQWLPVEASRGCWWGEKVHCTFCGLNGETMRFRAKSARRVVEETDELVARHGVRRLQFADNILSVAYFDDLLPLWAGRTDDTARFFEIKSNLSRAQLALMRRAGVTTIQAGIESLCDRTLRVMGKGVSAAQNLALLRWCAELGIDPLWNVIYAFPGETLSDYAMMGSLMRDVVHLPPPDAAAPIRMDRFSPNFARWEAHGFTGIAPMPAYRHVFPFDAAALQTLAYYFRYDHPQLDEALLAGAEVALFVREWQDRRRHDTAGELLVRCEGRAFFVDDTRYTREPATWRLDAAEIAVLLACDRPRSRSAALVHAMQARDPAPDPQRCEAALASLLERRVVAEAGTLCLTLACMPDSVRRAILDDGAAQESDDVILTSAVERTMS